MNESRATRPPPSGWLVALERMSRLINRVFLVLACVLVLVILALVCISVFSRYLLNAPIAEALDITTFLLVFVFFLAIAPALQAGNHIEVDLFDPMFPPRWRKWQRLTGKGITLVFALVLLIFIARRYEDIVDLDELSFTMLTFPLKYIYWIGPIGAAQFLFTAALDFMRFACTPHEAVESYGAMAGH